MAREIGEFEFIQMQGPLSPPGEASEEITRKGVSFHAYRHMGERAEVTSIVTVAAAESAGDADGLINDYKALQGTLVDVVDVHGIQHSGVMVLTVDPVGQPQRVRTPVGAVGDWLVTARWALQISGG